MIEKTDVNSEDYEKCLETNNQTRENKRKRKLGIDIAVSSSENDTEDDEKENLPIAPVKRFLSCHNAADMENAFNLMTNEHNNNKRINNELVSSFIILFYSLTHCFICNITKIFNFSQNYLHKMKIPLNHNRT